ncbi:histocompatibility antigen 60b-like [Mus pahari]|uniref:histocompatibility antigen 60b-like n=1 Tax=Mus pahari TaxID=10093 RepID=UPI000A310765|nr:histocompatibility antigen 60b-like [Mus pahari]
MAKGSLSLNLSLLVLLDILGATLSTGQVFLSCELKINYRNLNGQCSVNEETLLDFGDENHKGNATMLCPALSHSLTDISEVMWNLQSGNHPLHVTIISQHNQGEPIHGHWAISTDKQCGISFETFGKTWRESHSGASCAMGQLRENKELEQGLRNVLVGDFSLCLKKLSPYSREMPKSTIKVLDTTQPTNGTQSHPTANNPQHNSATQGLGVAWIVIICIGLMLLIVFLCCMLKKISDLPFQNVESSGRRIAIKIQACFRLHSNLRARCSLLLLFLCNLICSPHHQLFWVTLEHCPCIFSKGSKRISDGIGEICAVDFGADGGNPRD